MPLQNVYLTDLIKTLQNEIVQLKHPIVKKEPLSTNLLSVKSKLKVEQGVNNVVNLISEDELNDVLYK
jgi:hypothetical protein